MGANAQTSVPTFTAGEVLTAANMNISARTGIPVFADSSARDAAFGGTGEKTLAEGQLCYLEDSNSVLYYDSAAWQSVGSSSGLVLISTTTITNGVTSVTVTNQFSSTYDNYKILISGGGGGTAGNSLKLGATTTGYYAAFSRFIYNGGAASVLTDNNGTSFSGAGISNTNGLQMSLDIQGPNLAKNTMVAGIRAENVTTGGGGAYAGFLNDTTQYTDFTIAGTTFTGGTIQVYGYAKS